MHADELNTSLTDQLGHPVYHYHLHVVALPVVDKEIRWSKRCKDPALVGTIKEVVHQISHSKKWASQKVIDETGHPQMVKSYSLLQDRFFHHMRDAGYDGFDRGERGSTAEHLAVTEYKVKQEQERLAQIQEAIETAKAEAKEYTTKAADARAKAQKAQEQLNAAAPKLKNMENLARRYTDNAERVLPPSGTLESGKAYRERKAIPVFQKLITVLRGLFHEYLDLKEQFNRLNRSYHMAMSKITTLENTFDRINREKHELASEVENCNTLCRGYGTETIEAEVRRIRDQEATQKRHRQVNRNRFEMGSR
jgi:DNA repair exonuclease SbcCD ATPase subunit